MSGPFKLLIIWSSGDAKVAHKMAFMYGHNALRHGWWQAVRLLVWGPSAKLLCEDAELQERVEQMGKDGVELLACKACSDQYGVSARLEELGIKVIYMGEPLTQMLKSPDWAALTF